MPKEPILIRDRPVGGQQRTSHWDSPKRQRTMSTSDKCWDLMGMLSAQNDGMNRSEITEVLVRLAVLDGIDLVKARTRILAAKQAVTA